MPEFYICRDCGEMFEDCACDDDEWGDDPRADEPETTLTECLFCPATIETSTGLEGIAEMERAGWEAVSGLDWCCRECSKARTDLIGED